MKDKRDRAPVLRAADGKTATDAIAVGEAADTAFQACNKGRSRLQAPVGVAGRVARSVLATAFSLIGGLICAQEQVPSARQSDPPLAPPTEAQLERGRELLDKIIHVIRNVPLQDSAAVLGTFGFTELETFIHPTNTYVTPKSTVTRSEIPAELLGTGFRSIENTPLVRSSKSDWLAYFGGAFNRAEACISIDDVQRRFADAAVKRSRPVWVIDRFRSPPRAHNAGILTFQPLATPAGSIGRIAFDFDYQTCADSFGFSYLKNQSEETSK